MQRPDINSLTCVNPECQLFDQSAKNSLKVRKVYGQDQRRFLQCKECQEEFSERRGTALFNIKIPEVKAVSVIEHLGEGGPITGTARLVPVAQDTVARLPRLVGVAGRHAQKFHDQKVQGITPQALEFDEQWSHVGKKGNALYC